MKDYTSYPHWSVSMSQDELFKASLEELFTTHHITNVVESGTYRGLGSTTLLANAILKSGKPKPAFVTIEVDKTLHAEAVKNLAQFDFVQPVWGLSISAAEAKKFIETDDAIINHHQYPDVFIDMPQNAQQFYLDEINGQLSKLGEKKTWFGKLKQKLGGLAASDNFEENVFQRIIPQIENTLPLFLLDSAGEVGYCEFKKVETLMKGKPYFLILDDIHHLKHFRSYLNIEADKNYKMLAKNLGHGWLIAHYSK